MQMIKHHYFKAKWSGEYNVKGSNNNERRHVNILWSRNYIYLQLNYNSFPLSLISESEISCFFNKEMRASSGTLINGSYVDPTLHSDSKSYSFLAFGENMCKAILPEKWQCKKINSYHTRKILNVKKKSYDLIFK